MDDPDFADLKAWRLAQGLSPQPDIAVISASLSFPIPDVLTAQGRKVVVFTTTHPDPERVKDIERHAGRVIVAGEDSVAGDRMVGHLADLGYRTIYSAAGPKVLHLLLAGGVLDRLYLTYANRLLGGVSFATIVEGNLFTPAVDMRLVSVYFDAQALGGLGQLFVAYKRA